MHILSKFGPAHGHYIHLFLSLFFQRRQNVHEQSGREFPKRTKQAGQGCPACFVFQTEQEQGKGPGFARPAPWAPICCRPALPTCIGQGQKVFFYWHENISCISCSFLFSGPKEMPAGGLHIHARAAFRPIRYNFYFFVEQ